MGATENILVVTLTLLSISVCQISCWQLDRQPDTKPSTPAASSTKGGGNSHSESVPCAQEGITPHKIHSKFNFCFKLGSQIIHQVTECPRGLCFNPSSSCCEAGTCGSASVHVMPGPGKKPSVGNKDATLQVQRKPTNDKTDIGGKQVTSPQIQPVKKPGGTTGQNKLPDQGRKPVSGGTVPEDFKITPIEMSYLHPRSAHKKDKVCGTGAYCTKPGKIPNAKDSHSYYTCIVNPETHGFLARWVNCPRNKCFRANKCSKC